MVTALMKLSLVFRKRQKTHRLLFESWFTWVNNKNGVSLTQKPVSCPPWMFVEFCLKRTEGKADAGTYEISSSSVIDVKPHHCPLPDSTHASLSQVLESGELHAASSGWLVVRL